MRWILLITIIFLGFFLIFSKNSITNQQVLAPIATPTTAPPSKMTDLVYKGITYRVNVVEVKKTETVSLFLNLKEKLTLSQAKEKHSCRAVVNGGFYSKSDTPLGLFKTNGQIVNPAVESALLNGFLLINPDESVITDQTPDPSYKTALQSGPLLVLNGQQQLLRINNDEPARRFVAGKTATGRLVFIAIYNPNSTFDGPLLGDLPTLLKKWETNALVTLSDTINLDGGSASGMITDKVNLGELTYVGSYFCIK